MLNAAQKLTIAAALLIAITMLLYPPFQDTAVTYLPVPIYAPLDKPPSGANEGQSIVIFWEVLVIQWAIVFTIAVGFSMTFRDRKTMSPLQTAILWSGIGITLAMLFFPPHVMMYNGPLFGWSTTSYSLLFLPEIGKFISCPLLAVQVIGVSLVTVVAMVVAGKRYPDSGRRTNLDNNK